MRTHRFENASLEALNSLEALTEGTRVILRPVLGPSLQRPGDVRGVATGVAPAEPWTHMAEHHRPRTSAAGRRDRLRRRDMLRALAVILSLIALLLTSSAMNWVTPARASEASPKRAVIVSGPVHSLTTRYKGYAKAMADAAEAQGMVVTRIFHPNATAARVRQHANGADLFVYVGHGNGWPSGFGPFQEATKNGLGLNPANPDQRTTSNVVYKGANWLREHIEFAPNAVVILSHLSYASGNASSGMPIPTRSVAVERIDNFANGFLASGARVVWALGWQPGADVIDALHQEDATMDAIFQTQYRSGVNPLNGWIGWNPGYYASVRVPGAEVHIDPDPSYGYLRGISGDLSFTTNEWRDPESAPEDNIPPALSDVSVSQSPVTVATRIDEELPIFTPNGDDRSDTIKVQHTLSESAFLDIEVTRDGNPVRRTSIWSLRGQGGSTWDGRRDDGLYVGDGVFRIAITPTDRAGNTGHTESVRVKVLSALDSPIIWPPLFDPTDGDALAATAVFRANLSKPGTISWLIRDRSGTVIRRAIDEADLEPGEVRFVWDGTDDAGVPVRQGKYTARVRVTRPKGSYGHDLTVRIAPFKLTPSKWSLRRGDTVRLTIDAAEAVKWKPVVTANRQGLKRVQLFVRKITAKRFTAVLKTRRAGKAGDLKIRVFSTDVKGGKQAKYFILKLR